MAFNEDSRVKIPAIIHLCRKGYDYISLKDHNHDPDTNIFENIFQSAVKKINPNLEVIQWGQAPDFDIIVNATSVGLKKNDEIKLKYNLGSNKLFFDLISNNLPEKNYTSISSKSSENLRCSQDFLGLCFQRKAKSPTPCEGEC